MLLKLCVDHVPKVNFNSFVFTSSLYRSKFQVLEPDYVSNFSLLCSVTDNVPYSIHFYFALYFQSDVSLFVNRLNTEESVIPYEYHHFDFCLAKDESNSPAENLGVSLFVRLS